MIPYEELVAALSAWRKRRGLPVGPYEFLAPGGPVFSEGSSPGIGISHERSSLDSDSEVLVSGDFDDEIEVNELDQTVLSRSNPDETTINKQNPIAYTIRQRE